MPDLPPGQTLTRRFPIVGERAPSANLHLDDWRLEVDGLVTTPVSLTLPQVHALPQHTRTVDIHCVTGWSRPGTRLTGTPLSVLLAHVGVEPQARFVSFTAYSDRGHDTSLPLEVARSDTWLVHTIDGAPLTPAHGFPLRTITPSRYFYKSLKWLHRITLLSADRLGYWERESAYHNNADPSPGDERYTTGSLTPARLRAFLEATDYTAWRTPRRLILSADLRRWHPTTHDIGAINLKDCDLRGVDLAGANLTGCNLTRCDLSGANLSGANLEGADLEGADFSGADLTDANLSHTFLSAARFFTPNGAAAAVTGLRLEGADGLLEAQERFLTGTDGPR
ncbi:MAG: DMSO/TMAO reductase YedYZ molybdopterin-dependent catalytic subunit [Myxococcota bacterium]